MDEFYANDMAKNAPKKPKTKTNRLFPQAGTNRGVGWSTALALYYLSQAILNPNTWIVVKDHQNNPIANKALMFMCQALANELQLKFFTFQHSPSQGVTRIRCDIFEEK